ncbi:uncharacterized protein LOC130994474 [Salvia miltiorrhiza]|uniref:uncharacterized protein LOC130994474 n=1 Tax=Salvia miltiorrhiza TaxID=226208 RepID=UPI0025AC78E3|nr:uncharacterized protein LOC130994474 [Salvia miltiorrhiza]
MPRLTFVFNYWGIWKRESENAQLIYDGYNSLEIEEEFDKMSYDRIMAEFTNLYGSKPNKVYALDEEYIIEKGLVLLRNDEHAKKVFDYLEILGATEILLFAEHDRDPIPQITPLPLFDEEKEGNDLEDIHGLEIKNDGEGIDDAEIGEGIELGESGLDGQEGRDASEEDNEYDPLGLGDGSETDSSTYSQDLTESDEELVKAAVVGDIEQGVQGHFELGMTFAGAKENESKRVRVVCIGDSTCPFLFLASKDGNTEGLIVKTLVAEHTCCRQRQVLSASQAYLANFFKDAIYRNPRFTSKDIQGHVKDHLKLHVSLGKCKRAKRTILTALQGSYVEEFKSLVGYIDKVNEIQGAKRVFKRIFVMLDACKKNWLGGCRPLISLDGCHLKGVTFGCLLTAVGKDGNEGIVPIAWAVVNKENKQNWNWFLNWLKHELQLGDGSRVTLISDMQKVMHCSYSFCIFSVF